MKMTIQSQVALAAVLLTAGAVCFAQSAGEATYKAKCATCHGAAGTPSAGMAKAMNIKAASAPEMKALSPAQMTAAVKAGKGKMKPIAGLNDTQVKDVVAYFRTLK
jgi:mono/diheme cytochrome c family protein